MNENVILYINSNKDIIVNMISVLLMIICTYYTNFRLINQKVIINLKQFLGMIITGMFYVIIKEKINYIIGVISLIIAISIIFSKSNLGTTFIATTISLSINYILSIISSIITFVINTTFDINNDYLNLIIMNILHVMMIYGIFKIKKLKYGVTFLKIKSKNESIDILVLNVSIIVIFSIVLLANFKAMTNLLRDIFLVIFLFFTIMFITIQKSIQLYYKQKLLVQELKETKEKLEEKTKEIKELEEENIKISKKSHTLVHKQKSLEHKIKGLIGETEISKEEVGELTNRIKEINKELYKEKTVIELDKTEIPQIDDMLKYMQSECKKNNIDFELQIKGNIYHMTNNLISKEDLETLLADHIKNAIIAINHGNNINRSILVRIGKIDECYGLYIYDSGIEFEKETLKNLGKKPSTTHANEGGTGMGFMNTFDTLKKCNASLIIEEYNEPSKDNYTKVIKIKFNNKNEFVIKTYREKSTM